MRDIATHKRRSAGFKRLWPALFILTACPLQRQKKLAQEAEQARVSRASYERPRVNEVMADGSRRVVGEEERQAGLARAKILVSKFRGAD